MKNSVKKPTNKPNLNRLKKLRAFLDTVKPHNFDMGTFCRNPFDDFDSEKVEKEITAKKEGEKYHCGSAACMLGFAAIEPSFKKAGLTLQPYADHYDDDDYSYPMPTYKGEQQFEAGRAFFGLDDLTTGYLFDPLLYPETSKGNLDGSYGLGVAKQHLNRVIKNSGFAPKVTYKNDEKDRNDPYAYHYEL